jgi:outer membrane receptor protein involved in Fe transport
MIMATIRERLLTSTFIAGAAALALTAAPAWAQSGQVGVTPGRQSQPAPAGEAQTPEEPGEARNQSGEPVTDDASEVEAVVVTGSRIRRNPTNAPTPLIQVGREEIIESGEPNIIDYLADIPALQQSVVPEDTTGAGLGDGGLSLLNLRNLGVARTLTLVDGRRHVGSATFTPASVDVDTIPRLLIQDVEVITGGASAIYGADAVAGVVNFILRRNFEGVELDAALAQINQDGQLNRRVSALVGRNFLDDRLNVYASAEYEQSDEVQDEHLDWMNEGCLLYQNDLDPAASQPDGIVDVAARCGFGTLSRLPGGTLTLASQTLPSPAADPDIPFAQCPSTTSTSGNCFVIDPGRSFAFNNQGGSRQINFGTFRAPAGLARTNVIGSPDAQPLTAFRDSRLPWAEAYRFQAGLNFDVTDNIQLFAEAKYVEEEVLDNFQPAFFNITIDARRPRLAQTQIQGINLFTIGTDNAYLDPALRTLIESNRRPNCASQAVCTPTAPTILDPRAQLINFTFELGGRPQVRRAETQRYVVGLRGDSDRFLNFINNFSWEIGYTHGETDDINEEPGTVDTERYAYAADAVVDTAGIVNGQPGQIVCRVQLIAASGGTVVNIGELFNNGRTVAYARTDPTIAGCVPIRIFGEGGVSQEAVRYLTTSQNTTGHLEQDDVLAFASGELWDFWGAGPIGVAVGAEWREEKLSGEFNSPHENGSRFLFANRLADFPQVGFDVREAFFEVRLPLLRDLPFAEVLEVTSSYRVSEYSIESIGRTQAYGFNAQWRPARDLLFRATYGQSVRAPNLNELFDPASQTFAQLTDPCDANVIRTTVDPRVRDNRIRNCITNPQRPDLGVSPTYTDPFPGTSNAGRLGGNTNLQEEESTSYTVSAVFTPRFLPRFSAVIDYFDIDIENAIAFVSAQQVVEQCFSIDTPNPLACATIRRDADTREINDFLSSPLNFALLRARGIDFAARYRVELADWFTRDLGRLDFSVRGTYDIRRQNFTNPSAPNQPIDIDATVGNPRVRFLIGTTYTLGAFAATWEIDHQTSQEIFDDVVLVNDPDNRAPELLTTGSFTQHDFLFRYELNERVRLRAGVINAFDAEPNVQTGAADNFDLFGRRFYIGLNWRM